MEADMTPAVPEPTPSGITPSIKTEHAEGSPSPPKADSEPKESSPAPTPYTKFTRNEKRLLTVLLGLATITSPLTATIYFPLLPLLSTHFHTSAQAINLTITIYIIFQALSPAIFGPLSDSLGRRPVYLLTLSLYVVGNLGLAVNKNSYAVLLVLRAIQSLGASAAFAVSYGVVADVCVPSERGQMLGPVSMALNVGACVGPVVGGWVAYTSGSYEWVFWALVIIGGILWLGVVALLPETARSVLEGSQDGASSGQSWWRESTWSMMRKRWSRVGKEKITDREPVPAPENHCDSAWRSIFKKFYIRNPFSPLRIIFHFDTFLVLWMHGSFYTVDYSVVASIPDIYTNIYHFNELDVGLAYLPRGVGIIVGGYCVGKLMDYNYKATARKIGWIIDSVAGDDLTNFPIERARSRGSYWLLVISTTTLVGYGWASSMHAHVSVLLILQFVQGLWGTCFYTIYNTLLVDMFPESPSTAAAAASLVRCGMAAAGVAVLQPLLSAAGRGWYFTALGVWSGGCGAAAVYLIKTKGMNWRTKRLSKSIDERNR
jgi:multidrug resistance protein